MVRLTVELIDNAPQFINTVRERELNLRGYKIPVIENMGVTKVSFCSDRSRGMGYLTTNYSELRVFPF